MLMNSEMSEEESIESMIWFFHFIKDMKEPNKQRHRH